MTTPTKGISVHSPSGTHPCAWQGSPPMGRCTQPAATQRAISLRSTPEEVLHAFAQKRQANHGQQLRRVLVVAKDQGQILSLPLRSTARARFRQLAWHHGGEIPAVLADNQRQAFEDELCKPMALTLCDACQRFRRALARLLRCGSARMSGLREASQAS